MIPLPWSAKISRFKAGSTDAFGNPVESWESPVEFACFWWTPSSSEPAMAGHDRVVADLVVVVAAGFSCGPRDRITVDGRDYGVDGEPRDYNHGPFGFSPDRLVIECRRVDG